MNASTLLALAAALAGGASLYLASPHQRWRATPWPVGPARALGAALLALSLFAFAQGMQATTAAFAFVTTLMLVLAVLPYVGALLTLRREK